MTIETWRALCGLAVEMCGSQEAFRREANILRRLAKQFGPKDTARMIQGAKLLRWNSLTSLGSKEGMGRRWALSKFWDSQKRPAKLPERVKAIMREASRG